MDSSSELCINDPGSTILATATAVPPHKITREQVMTCIGRVFHLQQDRLEATMGIIGNAQIRKRHSVFPLEYTITPRQLSKTNEEYQQHSILLGREAAEEYLTRASLRPGDIALLITVSYTGFMIPSLDAYLINLMGFRPDVRRLPITELGCAAGAMSLARAWEFCRAFPRKNVLVVCVELPTLTFQSRDTSTADLICSVLFGDGAGYALDSSDSIC